MPAVVLTRPPAQTRAWAQRLRDAGITVIEAPLTGIGPPARPPSQRELTQASHCDWLIFTSRHAVAGAREWLESSREQKVIAIGQATAAAATTAGWNVRWVPAAETSEALLNEAGAPAIDGHVVIVGGSGGRRLLKAALSDRGCEVQKLIVYRRIALRPAADTLQQAVVQDATVVFLSGHALRQWQRLSEAYDIPEALGLTPLVASGRLCKLARQLGFRRAARILPEINDAALLSALSNA